MKSKNFGMLITESLIAFVIEVSLKGLLLMLAAGTLHETYNRVPPLGFWSSVSIAIVASVFFPSSRK
jgi:hypothetical protein